MSIVTPRMPIDLPPGSRITVDCASTQTAVPSLRSHQNLKIPPPLSKLVRASAAARAVGWVDDLQPEVRGGGPLLDGVAEHMLDAAVDEVVALRGGIRSAADLPDDRRHVRNQGLEPLTLAGGTRRRVGERPRIPLPLRLEQPSQRQSGRDAERAASRTGRTGGAV